MHLDDLKSQSNIAMRAGNSCYAPSLANTGLAAQQEEGVASAMRRLTDEIAENAQISDNLRSTLGISCPEEANIGKEPREGLIEMIRRATFRISRSNRDLTDVLRHLNS